MSRLNKLILIIIFFIIILVIFINNNYSQSITETFEKKSIMFDKIHHIKELEKGALIFYEINSGIGYVFMKKQIVGWSLVTKGGFLDLNDPSPWFYSNHKVGKTKHPILYGHKCPE
ncbi:MAG: hypothetical protein AAGU27_21865 [Dehalobacterium sp.]